MRVSLLFIDILPPKPNRVGNSGLKKRIPVPVQVVKSGPILLYCRGREKKMGTYGQSSRCK